MDHVHEISRHASPGARPHPLTIHEGTLWIGSWETSHLYAIDPKTWTVLEDVEAPGQPYGLVSFEGGLRVVVSLGENDDRYLYRFVPGTGFDLESKTPCPDFTGSHLASDGTTLYLGQMTHQRIVALDAHARVAREIPLPTRCGGMAFGGGAFHIISADDEFDVLTFATLDLMNEQPEAVVIAGMPVEARSLGFDGTAWWTNLREASAIVSFT